MSNGAKCPININNSTNKFSVVPVTGDGNCIFRSVAMAYSMANHGVVQSEQENTIVAVKLRDEVCQYLTERINNSFSKLEKLSDGDKIGKILDPMIVNLNLWMRQGFPTEYFNKQEMKRAKQCCFEYIKKISVDKTWVGSDGSTAMSVILQCDIAVYELESGNRIDGYKYYGNKRNKKLQLLYSGGSHYDALVPFKIGKALSYLKDRKEFVEKIQNTLVHNTLQATKRIDFENQLFVIFATQKEGSWEEQMRNTQKQFNKHSIWKMTRSTPNKYVIQHIHDADKKITLARTDNGRKISISATESTMDESMIAIIVAQANQQAILLGIKIVNINCSQKFREKNSLFDLLKCKLLSLKFKIITEVNAKKIDAQSIFRVNKIT